MQKGDFNHMAKFSKSSAKGGAKDIAPNAKLVRGTGLKGSYTTNPDPSFDALVPSPGAKYTGGAGVRHVSSKPGTKFFVGDAAPADPKKTTAQTKGIRTGVVSSGKAKRK